MPATAVPILTSGLVAFPEANTQYLAPIADAPNREVFFSQEYRNAPGMTMLSINPGVIARVDSVINAVAPNAMPPLEKEIAICNATRTNDVDVPIPTATEYAYQPVVTTFLDGGIVGELNHVRGRLTAISVVPETPPAAVTQMLVTGATGITSFAFAATVRNVDVSVRVGADFWLRADTITMSCRAVISPATTNVPTRYLACGEQNVRCLNPTVTVSGVSSNLPLFALPFGPEFFTDRLRDAVTSQLQQGVNLHFQNFASTALVFLASGPNMNLTLMGASTLVNGQSVCSPVPPADPPLAPTRALSRVDSVWGKGQETSNLGNVRAYDVVPEANVRLETNTSAIFEPMHRAALPEGSFAAGVEAPSLSTVLSRSPTTEYFAPQAFSMKLRTVRKYRTECWVRPTGSEQFRELTDGHRGFVLRSRGGRAVVEQGVQLDFERPPMLDALSPANFEKDVMPWLSESGLECPECNQSEWTRVTLQVPSADGEWPIDGPQPFPLPNQIVIWLEYPFEALDEYFGPQMRCGYAEMLQSVVSDQRISDPVVTVGDFKLDSADLSPTALNFDDQRDSFRRRQVSRNGKSQVEITLTDRCVPPLQGQGNVDSCWAAKLGQLPNRGVVTVKHAFSGTTIPRAAVLNAAPADFGRRAIAVQGLFDRSAIEVLTAVPDIYRSIGLTQQLYDSRGTLSADWAHDVAADFAAPGGVAHIPQQKQAFQPPSRPFFPDWVTDRVTLRHRALWPSSQCLLPEMKYAVPTEIEFSGASFNTPRSATPGQLALDGPGPFGDWRVSPSQAHQFSALPLSP